jgi:hypothetical protein
MSLETWRVVQDVVKVKGSMDGKVLIGISTDVSHFKQEAKMLKFGNTENKVSRRRGPGGMRRNERKG